MRSQKRWHKLQSSVLTKEAKKAKQLLQRICDCLTKYGGRKFYLEMGKYCHDYEGYIIDSGKCVDDPLALDGIRYDPNGKEEIGMIFFGGHFCEHKTSHRPAFGKGAISKAWVSLLEDCIGIGELGASHTLTEHLKSLGPVMDFNCASLEELEAKLKKYEQKEVGC